MVSLGNRVKKGMTAIRFYLLEDIDIFYDEAKDTPCGREGSEGSKGSEGSWGGGGRLRRQF